MSNQSHSSAQVVIATYRPHAGLADKLHEIVRRHVPTLREEGLITDRPATVLVAADDTVLEIFEWMSSDASTAAHTNPRISALWEEMMAVAEMTTLASLSEAGRPFASFRPFE